MKAKTRKAVAKRFYLTKGGKGKVMRARANNRHRLIPKSKRGKALAAKPLELTGNLAKNVVAWINN